MQEKNSANRGKLKFIVLALLGILAAAACIFLILKFSPTKDRMPYTAYFGQMQPDEAAIVLQNEILPERAIVNEAGSVYLPYDIVKTRLNERFYLDQERSLMLFTTAEQTLEIPFDSAAYTVIDGVLPEDPTHEESFDDIIVLQKDGSLYLNLDFAEQYTNAVHLYEKDTQHVWIRDQWGDTLMAAASKESAVRFEANIKSPILTTLEKGDSVVVLEELGAWLRVISPNGFIGYVKSNRMTAPSLVDLQNEGFIPQEYPSAADGGKISLIWQMLENKSDNKRFEESTKNMEGINVISPTWFSLADNDGNVTSIGTKTYTQKAHKKDMQVWGLISDFSPDMDTSVVLASAETRRTTIGQLIDYAKMLELDGINLDFEYVEEADGENFSQFVRELSIACRRNKLVLSVDVVAPFDFNAYLNRREIAAVSDYLINMGYDEHYPGIDHAGTVASLSFEENAIQKLLEMGIPSQKIITGVPFYTRIWYTSTDADGQTHVNSEELGMNAVANTISSWNVTPTWDSETNQNYAGWTTDDGVLCEIWIEDAESLQRKCLLVPKYDLGGVAIWALGFQDSSIWPTISESISMTKDDAAALEQTLADAKGTAAETEAHANEEADSDAAADSTAETGKDASKDS